MTGRQRSFSTRRSAATNTRRSGSSDHRRAPLDSPPPNTGGESVDKNPVSTDGWVIPCAMLTGFKAGNVRDSDIIGIWHKSHAFEEIRRLSDRTMNDVPECGHCHLRSVCDGGCRGHAFNLFGELVSPNPDCHLRRPRPFLPNTPHPLVRLCQIRSGRWRRS